MRAYLPVALAGAFLLSSCQPSQYRILAVAYAGQVALTVSAEDRGNPLGATARTLSVRDRERVVWEIEQEGRCATPSQAQPFPVVYGRAPDCYRVVIPAQPLEPASLYLVTGDGSRDGNGYFIPGPPAQNFEWSDVADRVRGWRDVSRVPVEDVGENGLANLAL